MIQDDIAIDGWAFEARLYAEDAGKGFLPATGKLAYLSLPDDIARVDSGVRAGDRITPFYDPMIAKVIVRGDSRSEALGKLRTALSKSYIAGVVTNTAFLSALCADEGFDRGDVDTGLIGRQLDNLVKTPEPSPAACGLAAIAALGWLDRTDDPDPWASLTGWRQWSAERQNVVLTHQETVLELTVTGACDGAFVIDGTRFFQRSYRCWKQMRKRSTEQSMGVMLRHGWSGMVHA